MKIIVPGGTSYGNVFLKPFHHKNDKFRRFLHVFGGDDGSDRTFNFQETKFTDLDINLFKSNVLSHGDSIRLFDFIVNQTESFNRDEDKIKYFDDLYNIAFLMFKGKLHYIYSKSISVGNGEIGWAIIFDEFNGETISSIFNNISYNINDLEFRYFY